MSVFSLMISINIEKFKINNLNDIKMMTLCMYITLINVKIICYFFTSKIFQYILI